MAHPSPVLLTWGTSANVPLPSFDPICLAVEVRSARRRPRTHARALAGLSLLPPRYIPPGLPAVRTQGLYHQPVQHAARGADGRASGPHRRRRGRGRLGRHPDAHAQARTHSRPPALPPRPAAAAPYAPERVERPQGYNLDYKLTPKQKADARAFCVLVEEDLHLALVRGSACARFHRTRPPALMRAGLACGPRSCAAGGWRRTTPRLSSACTTARCRSPGTGLCRASSRPTPRRAPATLRRRAPPSTRTRCVSFLSPFDLALAGPTPAPIRPSAHPSRPNLAALPVLQAYLKAREIYSHLATKLGNQHYFFGAEYAQ